MLSKLPTEQQAVAVAKIRTASSNLGVPYQRATLILYWHVKRKKISLSSLEVLDGCLSNFAGLIREFNQEIVLRELRQQGSAPNPVCAEEE